jgi:hypothetical protein
MFNEIDLQALAMKEETIMRSSLTTREPRAGKVAAARSADLPTVLRDLGWELKAEGSKDWRVPGNGGLTVWKPDDGQWGWIQFSTGEGGDAISFLVRWAGMSRSQAVETLADYCKAKGDRRHVDRPVNANHSTSNRSRRVLRKTNTPPEVWQQNASEVVRRAESRLREDDDLGVWSWLYARGLKASTIHKARLGWIGSDQRHSREKWGLPAKHGSSGRPKALWIPSGLLIPVFDEVGNVIRIWIRQFSEDRSKYYILPGSCMGCLILGDIEKPLILVETDLDAWLVNQEAGDLITVGSLGSSGSKPDARLAAYLLVAQKILVSLDADQPGNKATKWWIDTFRKAKHWPVPWSKDPGEAFGIAQRLIRTWVQAGLK